MIILLFFFCYKEYIYNPFSVLISGLLKSSDPQFSNCVSTPDWDSILRINLRAPGDFRVSGRVRPTLSYRHRCRCTFARRLFYRLLLIRNTFKCYYLGQIGSVCVRHCGVIIYFVSIHSSITDPTADQSINRSVEAGPSSIIDDGI
jgi:hypothetical protein